MSFLEWFIVVDVVAVVILAIIMLATEFTDKW